MARTDEAKGAAGMQYFLDVGQIIFWFIFDRDAELP